MSRVLMKLYGGKDWRLRCTTFRISTTGVPSSYLIDLVLESNTGLEDKEGQGEIGLRYTQVQIRTPLN